MFEGLRRRLVDYTFVTTSLVMGDGVIPFQDFVPVYWFSPDIRAFCENEEHKQNSFVSACHYCPAQFLGPEFVEKDGSIPTGE